MPFLKAISPIQWHYELEGEGAGLLFIHGWGVNMRIWKQQTKYFSTTFKVLAIDLPGHGKSSFRKLSLEEIAKDFEFILKHLDFKKAGVISSSLGGLFALKLYEICPQQINFLVFVGSQPKFATSADYPFGIEVKRLRHLADQLEHHYPAIINIFFRSLFTREERQSRRFKWIQTFRKFDDLPDRAALLELLDILEKEDLRAILSKVQVPVQLINGTEDYITTKECILDLKKKLPQVRVDWFEKCGHFPFLSKPHEFNGVLEDFLRNTVHT